MPSSNCHFLPCIQISQEAVINIYTLNVGAPKYIKQLLIGTKGRNWHQHNQFNCLVPHNSSIQLFSHVLLFATLWTAACQASMSISKSQACSNSCSSSRWCYPTILSSVVPFSFCLQSFPASGSFPVGQFLHQVAKGLEFQLHHQSFQWNSGLISFRMDWLDLFAVQGTLKGLSTTQFKSINSLVLSFLYSPTLTPIHDYWKNHSFD